MHLRSFTLLAIALLLRCTNSNQSKSSLATEYYQAFDESDFKRISEVIADTIVVAEGEYVTRYSSDSFYTQFKWDSTFNTRYQITDLKEDGDNVFLTVSSSSIRYNFLRNNPLICEFKVSFKNQKISRIDVLGCPNADWGVWQAERDSLVSWTSIHHPELDGFINDLTMAGALNYLKAIEYYQSNEN